MLMATKCRIGKKVCLGLTQRKKKPDTEHLTATERFSRELFATIVSASQNGAVNEASIEKLTSSLAEKVQNSPPRKVFSIFDVKVVNNDTVQAFKNYNDALNSIYTKNSGINYTVLDVLQEFIVDEDNVDASVLAKLDPIIKNMNKVMEELIKTRVPQSISDCGTLVFINSKRYQII